MPLAHVSLLFLLQMAFGLLVALLVLDRPGIGPKYTKLQGWILLGLYGLALTLVAAPALSEQATGEVAALGALVVVAAAASLLATSVAGWDRPGLETALLLLALLAGGGAVGLSALLVGPVTGWDGADRALVAAAAFGSALVMGFTTAGMILGHWYLTDHGLDIRHLGRLVRPLPWLFAGKAVLSGLALWLMWDRVLGPGVTSLDDLLMRSPERVLDVVNVWARIPVGLVVPAVLAVMTGVTVRMQKTQPATGILYAMCGIVYLGEALGKMVEGTTGVPL